MLQTGMNPERGAVSRHWVEKSPLPGKVRDPDSRKVIQTTTVYHGRCLDKNKEMVYWVGDIIEGRKHNRWARTVEVDGMKVIAVDYEGLMPVDTNLKSQLRSGKCKKMPPRPDSFPETTR